MIYSFVMHHYDFLGRFRWYSSRVSHQWRWSHSMWCKET